MQDDGDQKGEIVQCISVDAVVAVGGYGAANAEDVQPSNILIYF